jgi:hypothetical protein
MSETGILAAFVAILLGISFMTSCYLSWTLDTPVGMDYGLGRYFYNGGNYTVNQTFNGTSNISMDGLGAKNVWGKWTVNSTYGLFPTELQQMNLLPQDSGAYGSFWARTKFGNVRYVNNSWEESYYLENINIAAEDFTAITIREGTYTSSLFFPGSYELMLKIVGNRVYVQEDNYVLGVLIPGSPEYGGFTLPEGVTSGKIGYKAVAVGYRHDLTTTEHIIEYNIEVYWNDALMSIVPSSSFQLMTGSDLITRSADIRTNIGPVFSTSIWLDGITISSDGHYSLHVLSHYEDVTVQSNDLSGEPLNYGELNKFLIIMGDVLTWGILLETPIPWWILMFIVGVPEFIISYIVVRLIRGGG